MCRRKSADPWKYAGGEPKRHQRQRQEFQQHQQHQQHRKQHQHHQQQYQQDQHQRNNNTTHSFINLPVEVRQMFAEIAANLAAQMDRIVGSGRLQATHIIPVGKEILDLSSLCCLVTRMMSGLGPHTTPTPTDLHEHVINCLRDESDCGCYAALALMDLDGDLLKSFPDDGDDGLTPVATQAAAMNAINREVERAISTLDALLQQAYRPTPLPQLKKARSLESMVVQLSHGLRSLRVVAIRPPWKSAKKVRI